MKNHTILFTIIAVLECLFITTPRPLISQQGEIPPFLQKMIATAQQTDNPQEDLKAMMEEESSNENEEIVEPELAKQAEKTVATEPVATEPVATEPVTTEQEKKTTDAEYSEEEIGFQGNWQKKKDWLSQGVEKNDATQELTTKVENIRQTFHTQVKTVDDALDDFYRSTGFTRGELNKLFSSVEKYIEKTKSKTKKLFNLALSQLSDETKEEATAIKKQYVDAYNIEENFNQHKNSLEQLKLNMQSIEELDKALRKRLQVANSKIDSMKKQADQSENLHAKMWHIIDDQKARALFYEISGIHEQIKATQQYLQSALLNDFKSVIDTVKSQIKKTNTDIKKLEKDGYFIINRTKRVEIERKKQLDLLEQKQAQAAKQTVKTKKNGPKKQKSWLASIKDFFMSFF